VAFVIDIKTCPPTRTHTHSSTPSTVCHTNKHTQLHAVKFVFNYTYDIWFRCLPFMFVGPMCVYVCVFAGRHNGAYTQYFMHQL